MAKTAKISPEQIATARKLLHDLPPKELPKTTEEAAVSLAKDFRKALRKGYTSKDISEILKREGIGIPVSQVKEGAGTRLKSARDRKKNTAKIVSSATTNS